MLQLDSRPLISWTPSSACHAERGLSEFSLSTLQNGTVFSRLPTRNSQAGSSMSDGARLYDVRSPALRSSSGVASIITSATGERSPSSSSIQNGNNNDHASATTDDDDKRESESGPGAPANGRRLAAVAEEGLCPELNISRTKKSPPHSSQHQQTEIAKAIQPTSQKAESLSLLAEEEGKDACSGVSISGISGGSLDISSSDSTTRPLKPTLNLPPIRLASVPDDRASSSSSPSCPSLSLLPSISEPHLPSLRGRASSPYPSSSATDNTSILATPATNNAKRCQSLSPPRRPSPTPLQPPASLPGLSSAPLLAAPVTALPSSLPESDVIPARRVASVLSSDQIGIDSDLGLDDRRLPPLTDPSISTTGLAESRTSRKRTLDEFQGNSPPAPAHPLSRSLAADCISNPAAPSASAPVGLVVGEEASATSEPSSSCPQGKSVPLRLHEGELPNRTDVDNSVESTIVLAHRAVTAIKSQALPRPKTIGPTFTIGKPGSHPFGVTRKAHDGVVESEDESDNESITTTTSSPHKARMMPWHRPRFNRDDSPVILTELPQNLEPVPAPRPLPSSSPEPPGEPGLHPLLNSLGNGQMVFRETAIRREPVDATENNNDQRTERSTETSTGENMTNSTSAEPSATTNTGSQTISPISRSGDGGSGDGGEDPNKRSRKLREHEEDNGVDNEDAGRAKRRKLDQPEEEGQAEPQFAGQADQDAAATSLFGLSKGPSPPPVPSGPPTVESVPSTAPTMDSAPAYSETVGTPATICDTRSDYHKSPVENTPSNVLPPISVGISPGRSPRSPRTSQHTTLPGVNSLFTVASAAEKHSMEHQTIQPNHAASGRKFVKAIPIQNLKIPAPSSNQSPAPNTRNYVDDYSRAIPFNDPAQQYRTMTPQSRQSPTVSPTENRNAPIAPAPPTFPGKASTSPLSQFTPAPSYYPPRNLGRPEHHATLPPLQTDWAGSLSPSEPNSARTPTSKAPKQGRNGTPKNGSIDSSQSSPSVAGGFKCTKEGCTAAPFSTQYLLNSHANVHSEERPHFCPVAGCSRGEGGKGFKRKNEMIRHGLVHQSPGYVCPFCPDKEHRYPRPDNLQRHVKAHHKDKSGDDPLLREVLAVRPEGGQRGRRRRLGPST